MGVKKYLFVEKDLVEIKKRISQLNENSQPKWGSMNVSQMLRHCDRILQVGTGKIILPKINPFLKGIGILTKTEMRIFNNGIPPNMPSFKQVVIKENCNFSKSKDELLMRIDEFVANAEKNNLLAEHPLFGKMNKNDWGFMEYKHLNHHLKQFKV